MTLQRLNKLISNLYLYFRISHYDADPIFGA